jgi:hypothetical protein
MTLHEQELTKWLRILQQKEPVGPFSNPGAFESLVAFYEACDKDGRRAITTHFSVGLEDLLFIFVKRCAEQSVTLSRLDMLHTGLVALAMGSDVLDPRETITAFSFLAHSSEKLGHDFKCLFEQVQHMSGVQFRGRIEEFLETDEEERAIYEMGFKESMNHGVFEYVRHDDFFKKL